MSSSGWISGKVGQPILGFKEARKAKMAKAATTARASTLPTGDVGLQGEPEAAKFAQFRTTIIGMNDGLDTPPSSNLSSATQGSVRKSPEVFEHHKLTPHELKTLIQLEEWIPRKYLDGDTSEDATSWSDIFVAGRKLIQEGEVLKERNRGETDEKNVDEVGAIKKRDGGKDGRDEKVKELEEKLKRYGVMEDKLARFVKERDEKALQGKDEERLVIGLATPSASGSRSATTNSEESAASWTTPASSLAGEEESSAAALKVKMAELDDLLSFLLD